MKNIIDKYQKALMYLIIVCSLIYGLAYFSAISEYNKEQNSKYQAVDKLSRFIVKNSNKCNLKADDVISKISFILFSCD